MARDIILNGVLVRNSSINRGKKDNPKFRRKAEKRINEALANWSEFDVDMEACRHMRDLMITELVVVK